MREVAVRCRQRALVKDAQPAARDDLVAQQFRSDRQCEFSNPVFCRIAIFFCILSSETPRFNGRGLIYSSVIMPRPPAVLKAERGATVIQLLRTTERSELLLRATRRPPHMQRTTGVTVGFRLATPLH